MPNPVAQVKPLSTLATPTSPVRQVDRSMLGYDLNKA